MLRRVAAPLLVAVIAVSIAGPSPLMTLDKGTTGFNDKMLIDHKGKILCVDWWAWPGHMIMHGDTLVGTGSCDVPNPPGSSG